LLALIERPENLGYLASRGWIPLLVLLASVLGSLHCLGMCGAFVAVLRPTPLGLACYHLGRLSGYLTLGGLAGLAGGELLNRNRPLLAGLAAIWLAGSLMLLGIKVWRGQNFHLRLPAPLERLAQRLIGHGLRAPGLLSGFVSGLSSVLLPCGWLYLFIVGATATQSFWLGAAFLCAFWLGTLPALSLAPVILGRLLGPLPALGRQLSASLLIGAGLLTIYAKFGAGMQQLAEQICH
jgi:sulfite exporter TauE/SafE